MAEVEYRVVREDGAYGAEELEDQVNRLLDEGWQPQGGVAVVAVGPGGVTYLQAMTRTTEPEREGGGRG